jgi:hypothetical protein
MREDNAEGAVRTERLLRVTGRRLCAGAVFERTEEGWRLQEAAPILRWTYRCRSLEEIRDGLRKRGLTWEWGRIHPTEEETLD